MFSISTNNISDHYSILKAYAGIAHIYLDTIQPAFAEDYLEKALKIAQNVKIKKEELIYCKDNMLKT